MKLLMENLKKIGFGGGCHWCTEAVFASLVGVESVQQGWINSVSPNDSFSEAVIVTFNPEIITPKDLIYIHLLTHSSTSNHSMRYKYRSAIYWFNAADQQPIEYILSALQLNFDQTLITQILPFVYFKASLPEHQNYYHSNPDKPFCQLYINPKLQLLKEKFKHLSTKDKSI